MFLFQKVKSLTSEQRFVVQQGYDAGLSRRQISLYADAAFTPAQMEEIRLGFLDGLKLHEVRVFADPRVDDQEMRRIRKIYRLSKEINETMNQLDHRIQHTNHIRHNVMPVTGQRQAHHTN